MPKEDHRSYREKYFPDGPPPKCPQCNKYLEKYVWNLPLIHTAEYTEGGIALGVLIGHDPDIDNKPNYYCRQCDKDF